MLMLRNLVTSLFEHEHIKTTLPKARDTARLAEKMITLGKKGDLPAYRKANGFILKPSLVPKVFGEFAKRYASRPGGYTRIHKYGNRQGDNAPHAILELVDNPRDIRYEMTAMSVGWDVLGKRVGQTPGKDLVNEGVTNLEELVERERNRGAKKKTEVLRRRTRWNVKKVLRYRGEEGVQDLARKAESHIDSLLTKPVAIRDTAAWGSTEKESETRVGFKAETFAPKPGETVPGGIRSPLHLAKGILGKQLGPMLRLHQRQKLGVDRSEFWNKI